MRKLTLIAIVVTSMNIFSSCNQKKELASILVNNCYWDIYEVRSSHPMNSCYRFDQNGNCNFYYYNFLDKKRTNTVFSYNDDDIAISNKWKMQGDSIEIRSINYYISKYSKDSVFLTGRRDTMILIKNCLTKKGNTN